MLNRVTCAVSFCLAIIPGLAMAAENGVERGKQEYMIACAGCHGESAKGTGPIAGILSIETPDLTTITERTGGGEFPYRNTTLVIDGRDAIRAHGGDMPIWGDRFVSAVRRDDPPWATPEAAELVAMGRILALVRYLESVQE
ncbi:c-type cytochrome [Tropicimonas sp. TH_r6]|uniref:c-type cytochrome n=1 Tax=Tropicimonas sp. TH_r6 TaxID=3082085 RepID=UPI00295444F1|nr:c-type cytochrome [Tropicimonas sp. TH_r6]MDV7145487.1 c-type cytochrome [Tropicimonas sp. TH_r6]